MSRARGLLPKFAPAGVATLAATAVMSVPPAATGHAAGCSFPQVQPPVGDTGRVYAIPHGCVQLAVPEDEARLPTVVVRRHGSRGRALTRRFRLPDTSLDRANGSIGICGHNSTYVFLVRYPFVSVVAQELYDVGGRRECVTDVNQALLWTGRLSSPPSLRMTWFVHRPPR